MTPHGISSDARHVESLFDVDGVTPNRSAGPRPVIQAADVIFAQDVTTGIGTVVYGRDTLARADRQARRGRPLTPFEILYVTHDEGSDELARLCRLVREVKGRHECRRFPE